MTEFYKEIHHVNITHCKNFTLHYLIAIVINSFFQENPVLICLFDWEATRLMS